MLWYEEEIVDVDAGPLKLARRRNLQKLIWGKITRLAIWRKDGPRPA
jgi:hypothetical protein